MDRTTCKNFKRIVRGHYLVLGFSTASRRSQSSGLPWAVTDHQGGKGVLLCLDNDIVGMGNVLIKSAQVRRKNDPFSAKLWSHQSATVLENYC